VVLAEAGLALLDLARLQDAYSVLQQARAALTKQTRLDETPSEHWPYPADSRRS
jgi:hypothetical protein